MSFALPLLHDYDLDAARALPELIHFGTSTWTYEGWKGLIYHHPYRNAKEFRARSLGEYANWPLFRCVGIDSSFYNPPSKKTLSQYAELTPSDFRWTSKVWERITIFEYPQHARYGELAGSINPDFLNPTLFAEQVLPAYHAHKGKTAALIFQFGNFPKGKLGQADFLSRLGDFLSAAPKDLRYAIEIRNPEFLTNPYFELLNTHGATHCFNHWSYMPALKDQMKAAAAVGGLTAPFYVARILTPLGLGYAQAVERFKPYNQLKEVQQTMRDDVIRLMERAVARNVPAFVIVNNRCEGNAPMTINQIIKSYVEKHSTT